MYSCTCTPVHVVLSRILQFTQRGHIPKLALENVSTSDYIAHPIRKPTTSDYELSEADQVGLEQADQVERAIKLALSLLYFWIQLPDSNHAGCHYAAAFLRRQTEIH